MSVDLPGIVSAKGKWLATAFNFEQKEGDPLVGVHLFDTDKGDMLYSAVLPDAGSVRLTAASSDGRWLALYGGTGTVFLWDVRGDSPPLRLASPGVTLADLTFSDDGRYLYGVGNEHILTWQWRHE
jgi:WD40 repeat protein